MVRTLAPRGRAATGPPGGMPGGLESEAASGSRLGVLGDPAAARGARDEPERLEVNMRLNVRLPHGSPFHVPFLTTSMARPTRSAGLEVRSIRALRLGARHWDCERLPH